MELEISIHKFRSIKIRWHVHSLVSPANSVKGGGEIFEFRFSIFDWQEWAPFAGRDDFHVVRFFERDLIRTDRGARLRTTWKSSLPPFLSRPERFSICAAFDRVRLCGGKGFSSFWRCLFLSGSVWLRFGRANASR